MHFVTGGAFNGKRRWVEQFYLKERFQQHLWLSAFDRPSLAEIEGTEGFYDLTIIEGAESFVLKLLETGGKDIDARAEWECWVENWEAWERSDPGRRLVIIGSDIGKGVVPMDSLVRRWRDETGRFYQYLSAGCERVDIVWYGIAQTIKKGGRRNESLHENG
jgi:adenosyl cobinamide kinase/adenosyl cobinamide phosphate guanylyltransferase